MKIKIKHLKALFDPKKSIYLKRFFKIADNWQFLKKFPAKMAPKFFLKKKYYLVEAFKFRNKMKKRHSMTDFSCKVIF